MSDREAGKRGTRQPLVERLEHGVLGNAVSSLAAQITSAVFTFVLTLYLVRALSPTGYGTFALAGAIGSVAFVLADFGIPAAASRFVAENRGDDRTIARILAAAVRVQSVFALATAAALIVAAPWIADAFDEPSAAWPIRAIAVSIALQSLMNLFCYVFIALGRTALNVPVYFVQSLLETSLGISLVAAGGGAGAAIAGRALGYLAAVALGLLLARRVLAGRVRAIGRALEGWPRRLSRYGLHLTLVSASFVLVGQVNTLIVGAMLTAQAVGVYAAPLRILVAAQIPSMAVANAVSPRISGPDVTPALASARLAAASRVVLYVQLLALPPMLLWPDETAKAFLGASYVASGDVLRAFTPYAFLVGFGVLYSVTANYLGEAGGRVPIALATAALNVGLSIVLIEVMGVSGAALGASLAYCFYAPAHLVLCRRRAPFPLAAIRSSLLRGLAGTAAMSAAMLAVGGAQPETTGAVLLGLGIGLLAYLAVIAALGARKDLRSMLER